MIDFGIILISFYCIILLLGFLIVKLLKIKNYKMYFTIIVSWILWLIFAIFVGGTIFDRVGSDNEIYNALSNLYAISTMNLVHHLAMLFSLYKVIRGNIAKS